MYSVYLGTYLVSSKRPMVHLGMLSVKNVMTMIDIILVRCISFLSVPWWCSGGGGGDDNGDDDDDVDCENKKFTNLSSETATETAGIGPSCKVWEWKCIKSGIVKVLTIATDLNLSENNNVMMHLVCWLIVLKVHSFNNIYYLLLIQFYAIKLLER